MKKSRIILIAALFAGLFTVSTIVLANSLSAEQTEQTVKTHHQKTDGKKCNKECYKDGKCTEQCMADGKCKEECKNGGKCKAECKKEETCAHKGDCKNMKEGECKMMGKMGSCNHKEQGK